MNPKPAPDIEQANRLLSAAEDYVIALLHAGMHPDKGRAAVYAARKRLLDLLISMNARGVFD